MYGNAEKQSADPSYEFPARKWGGLTQSSAVYLAVSMVFNLICPVIVSCMAIFLIFYYLRNPIVVTQDEGIPFYRRTSKLHYDVESISTFTRMTTETLIRMTPEPYDVSGLEYFVAPPILETFEKLSQTQADARVQFNRSQFWKTTEIRRYNNPQLPQYIGIAISGERVVVQESKGSEGYRAAKQNSAPSLMVVYLDQVPRSAENPWGLMLVGIQEEPDLQKAQAIWDNSIDLAGTLDLQKNQIQPVRAEFLPDPLFIKQKFYNWFEKYE